MILDAVTQALDHHTHQYVTLTGDLCACGQLTTPGDHNRHVARKVLDAIQDLAGDDAA